MTRLDLLAALLLEGLTDEDAEDEAPPSVRSGPSVVKADKPARRVSQRKAS